MAIDRDLELMLRVREGDAESFDELLRRFRHPLVSFFCRMVRDPALAEDLAQETFLRVYRARERYTPDAKFSTWLYRIATNLALNAIRDRRGERSQQRSDDNSEDAPAFDPADPKPSVEQKMMQLDRERLIHRAVSALPENQKAAVILHKYHEADYRQIAKILKVSESAVKSLLFRAYESLRRSLEPLLRGGSL